MTAAVPPTDCPFGYTCPAFSTPQYSESVSTVTVNRQIAPYRLCHAQDRVMGRALWAIAVRTRLEVRFKDGFQDELESSLDHTVMDRWNREDTNLGPALLRDCLLPQPHGGHCQVITKNAHLCSRREDYRRCGAFMGPCIFALPRPAVFLKGKASERIFHERDNAYTTASCYPRFSPPPWPRARDPRRSCSVARKIPMRSAILPPPPRWLRLAATRRGFCA